MRSLNHLTNFVQHYSLYWHFQNARDQQGLRLNEDRILSPFYEATLGFKLKNTLFLRLENLWSSLPGSQLRALHCRNNASLYFQEPGTHQLFFKQSSQVGDPMPSVQALAIQHTLKSNYYTAHHLRELASHPGLTKATSVPQVQQSRSLLAWCFQKLC